MRGDDARERRGQAGAGDDHPQPAHPRVLRSSRRPRRGRDGRSSRGSRSGCRAPRARSPAFSITGMSDFEPMTIPTRGASTSSSSNCVLDLGLGGGLVRPAAGLGHAVLHFPLDRPQRRCRVASAYRRTGSARPPRSALARAAAGVSPSAGHVEHSAAGGDERAVAARRCRRGAPRPRRVDGARPRISSPLRRATPGSPLGASTTRHRPVRRPLDLASVEPARPRRARRAGRAGRERSRGSTACVSGSPKRQLYSSTFGPSAVIIRPA